MKYKHPVLLGSFLLAALNAANAQSVWKGTTDNLWTTAGNWSPSGAPGSGVAVSFDGTGTNLTTSLNGTARPLGSLTFTSAQTSAVQITTTNAAQLSLGPATAGTFTILDIAAGNHKFVGTNGGSGATADFRFLGTTGTNFILKVDGATSSFEINGRIANSGGTSANRNFEKTGTGSLIFSGNSGGVSAWQFNSGTTGFTVSGGVLRFASDATFGNSSNKYVVSSGAALELTGGFAQTINAGTITLNDTGIGSTGALRSVSGNNIISGTQTSGVGGIVLATSSSIGVDADKLTISQVVSGSLQNLTKVGAGTLVLGGANTYSGTTTISSGTLEVQGSISSSSGITNNASLVFNSASAQSYGNAIDGSGSLTKPGAGTLTLSGANTYAGGTTVSLGTLTFQNTGAKPASGTHAFAAGTTLGLGVSGPSGFTSADIANAFADTMTGNLANITVAATTNVGIDTTNGDFTFSNSISGSPAKSLAKLGANTLTLSGTNTYTGGTTISAGILQFAQTSSMPAAGAVVVQTGTTLAVNAGGAGEFTNVTSGNGSIGGLLAGLGGQSGGTVSYTGNVTLGIDTTNASGSLAYSGAISDVGTTLGLTKRGAGTLTLNAANSYAGATSINGGTLQLGDGGTTGSLATGAISIATGATFAVNQSDSVTQGTDFSAAAITGAGGFTQAGAGTTILTANNTYTGATTVSTGTLQIGTGIGSTTGTLGNNSNTSIASGAVLKIERDTTTVYAYTGALSGSGTVQIPTGRRLDFLTNNQTSSGNLSFTVDGLLGIRTNFGVTAVHLGEISGSGTISRGSTVGGAATVFIGGKNTNSTYTGVIGSAQLSVEKVGTGTLTLTGANNYGGATTVSAGTLTLSNAPDPLNANTVNDASTVTIAASGATLNLTYSGTDKVDKLFIGTTQLAAGVYGPSATSIPQITGSGTLTVATGPAGFSGWITGNFANGTVPSGKQGPNDDPDNDGISNLVEYAVAGQDPTVANPTIGSFAANMLSFTKRADATGLTYAIQESTDLGSLDDWTEVAGGSYVNNSTTISFTLTPPAPVKNFIRLKVTAP